MTTQKKLTRSMSNRKIAGICGGLGEHFNVDPLVFRIIFLVLLFGGGSGFLLYLVLWIVIPEDKTSIPYQTLQDTEAEEVNSKSPRKNFKENHSGIFWGILLVAFGFLWLGRSFGIFYFHWFNVLKLWPLLIIWLGISLLPIKQVWKNVCSFIILAIAVVLIFILPAGSCCRFFDDDFGYKIRRKFNEIESNINEYSKSELVKKDIQVSEKIKGIIVEGPWEVTITQDDTNNSASVEYNIPESKVTAELRSNGYLYIRSSLMSNYWNKTLNATINAASLEKIKASGAATLKMYGQFRSDCDISLSGASKMEGFSCEGDNANISLRGASELQNFAFKGNRADVDISGASNIDFLNLNVKRFQVDASGASHIYGNGYVSDLSITGSGSSYFNMYDLESESLNISLSGASSAEVTVNRTIKGTLTGASLLNYKKAENINEVSTSGGSKIIYVK